MANKTFVVSYLIRARDQYSKIAARVAQSSELMKKKIGEAGKSFEKFSGKMRTGGKRLTVGATLPILFLANSLKNAARDAGETESKFATVFSSISTKANKVAADLAKNYGLASTKSKQLLSDTGDLLAGFGFSQEEALNVSKRVNELAVDLASFTNYAGGAEGASAALTKALLGERESLKSLGIAISEDNVKKKIAAMMAEGHRFASLRQAKAQATLALAIEQSKNAVGDFSRTQDQLANQERITASRLQDLKESFGQALLPIALLATKALRRVAEWMLKLSPGTKKVILIVAGLVAILGPLLLALGSLTLIWPILTAGVAAFGAALAAAFLPITLIAGAAFLLIKYWEPVEKFMFNLGKMIFDIVDAIANFSLAGLGGKLKDMIFGVEADRAVAATRSQVDVGVNVGLDKGLKQTTSAVVSSRRRRRPDVGVVTGG